MKHLYLAEYSSMRGAQGCISLSALKKKKKSPNKKIRTVKAIWRGRCEDLNKIMHLRVSNIYIVEAKIMFLYVCVCLSPFLAVTRIS